MKKKVLSVFLIFALLLVSGCGKTEEEKEPEKEPTTLTEYVESFNRDVSQYEFKCAPLENNSIIYFDYSYSQSRMFLSDGKVYDVVFNGKTFSNGEQCKLNENYPLVKKVIAISYEKYIITEEGDVCKYTTIGGADNIECNLNSAGIPRANTNAIIVKQDNIVSILGTSTYNKNINRTYKYYYVYYHLNSDNKVYKTTIESNGKIVSSVELLSIPNYGNVRYISANLDIETNTITINNLITNMGYYELQEVKTEECTKYVDVECQTIFVKNEVLDKYWNSIKYVYSDLVFTNDGHLYSLSSLKTLSK